MASVKYHGEFPEGKDTIIQHGYEFEAGKSVSVTDKDHLAKFAGNRFFEVSGESDKDAVNQGKDDAEKAEVETLQGWLRDHQVPFHHKAGLNTLRKLREDYEAAQLKAQEG